MIKILMMRRAPRTLKRRDQRMELAIRDYKLVNDVTRRCPPALEIANRKRMRIAGIYNIYFQTARARVDVEP